ncbi:MAG: hypothetical protein KC561_20590, partial [Myxococcales bacterium]|nr:hypothetical protein [Myxococcales bacterium]
ITTRSYAADDPYLAIALDAGPERDYLAVCARVAELIAVKCPEMPTWTLYFDKVEQDGRYRAYLRDEQLLPGHLHYRFEDLDSAVEWMISVAKGRHITPDPDAADREVEQLDGGDVMEALLEEELPFLWQGLASRELPDAIPEAIIDFDPQNREPGWQRLASLYALQTVINRRSFPAEADDILFELDPVHIEFWAHLEAFVTAIEGKEIPPLIIEAKSDRPQIASQADAWMQSFMGGGANPDAPPAPATEFEKQLYEVMMEFVGSLTASGDLDLAPGVTDELARELVQACGESRSPKHLIRKALNTLWHSDYVEEIYVGDDELQERLLALSGGSV